MSLKKPKTNILTFFKPRSQKNANQVLDKDMSGNVNSASTCINYAEEPIPEHFEEIIEGSNEVNPILNPDDLEQIMSKQPNIDLSSFYDPNDPINELPKDRTELKARIELGPFQPVLPIYPRVQIGKQKRSFHAHYFKKYNWIEYSIAKDAAFCFSCRFFKSNNFNSSQLDSAFTTKGFRNWANATKLLDKHQFSKSHLTSSTSLHQYVSGKPIDVILDNAKNLSLKQRETDRLMNRKYMERLIDITIFLGKTGKPFRGHNEKDESNNKGLFLELTDLLKKYDSLTKNHLENGPKNAQYTSNYIQNDIIQSINNVLKQKLSAIFKNKFVSIMADETSDCGHYEQLSIVIRCYDSNKNRPVEYFVGLLRLMSTNSQSIFDSLNSCVGNFGIPWSSVISVCFDGAATMAGCYNGVQIKCKEKNENIFYVHCYAHCLNLVLIDSIGHKNRVLFDFFGTVQLIYAFLEGSSTRHAVLEKVAKEVNTKLVTLKSLSTTRWACRYEAVAAIKLNYTALVKTLENIYEDTKLPEIRAKTQGIIKQMKSFNFIFSLNMMYPILKLIVKVSANLQAKQLNLLSATSLITSLNTTLQKFRSDDSFFNNLYKETVQSCTLEKISIPEVRKRKVSCLLESKNSSSQIFHETMEQEIKINCFNVALDNMISGLNDRFSQETLGIISSVGNVLQLSPTIENIKLLNKVFAIDMDKLEQEIKLLKGFTDIPCGSSTTTIGQWLDWLQQLDRKNIFSHFYDVLMKFLVIPVTSCSCERSFSKLSIVKSKLRNTMTQSRLEALLLMFVEQELLSELDYDNIIDEFKNIIPHNRRLIL